MFVSPFSFFNAWKSDFITSLICAINIVSFLRQIHPHMNSILSCWFIPTRFNFILRNTNAFLFCFLCCLIFKNHDLKSDDITMSGAGSSVSGSDMGSFSSTSKCISSNELLSTSAAKQGNGKRYSNIISVIKW